MIQRIGVVGAGTMGAGIAQLCAQSGFSVKVFDADPRALERLKPRLKDALAAAVLKGKLTTYQSERAYHAVDTAASVDRFEGADLVIEAAAEDLAVKRDLFARLSKACPDAILATNTSSLSVGAIAEAAEHPERVLGIHFFNPPVAMRLVEMVRAPRTSDRAFQECWELVIGGLRKTPVAAQDRPGFIVNRVMRPYYVEAQRLAAQGAGIAALDEAARAAGAPMGPFELMDLIGLDVNLAITKVIHEALGRPERFAPPALQQRLVDGGDLGRKSERGFYLYAAGKRTAENPRALAALPVATLPAGAAWDRLIGAVIAEAELAASEGVASRADIDLAIKLAMNFPRGPFQWRSATTGSI